MKTFFVFTHEGLAGIEVEAETKEQALEIGLVKRQGAMIPASEREGCGGYKDEQGKLCYVETHVTPARPAVPLERPFAHPKPKSNHRHWLYRP